MLPADHIHLPDSTALHHVSLSSLSPCNSTLLNFGTWLSVLGGIIYDAVGPKPTGLAATLLIFVGYLLMYLAVQVRGWRL